MSESPGSPLKRALRAIDELQARLDLVEGRRREPIAVIGAGCRLPGGADGPDALWRLLSEGKDAVREVPAERWDTSAVYDPDPEAPGKAYTRWGGFLESVDGFDPQFFGIAPREAVDMDPQQRLLLEVSWEALEHAGQAPDALAGSRSGVFTGICSGDYEKLSPHSHDPERIGAYSASGIAHSVASGRVAYLLGLQGPAVSVDTACSSSLVAVHLACQSLRAGECRLALAGGVHLMLSPANTILFCKSRMMSASGRCHTFGANADGFVLGEGCTVLALKRLSDARADGDRVLAVIRGTAANQDGASGGLTVPSGPAQEAVIRDALADAGLAAADVGYVEAHGTGTALGDPIEVRALAAALGERPGERPLLIGSIKSNLGHLEAAAGASGLLKAVLAVHHGEIPPHLHAEELSPHLPWSELPLAVPRQRTPWPAGPRRVAGVSAFGFSGTNVHVIVEEPPAEEPESVTVERPRHLLALSARSESALRTLAERYAEQRLEGDAASDLAHTANAGRAQLPVRAAVAFGDGAELRAKLEALAAGEEPALAWRGTLEGKDRPRLAFLFTGQGSQYPGMARALFETQPSFRRSLEECAGLLRDELDRPLLDLLFDEKAPLDQTGYTQPALFALEYALAGLWQSWGVEPAAVLGHSVGEYVAAAVAGVFSLEDGLRLVAARGRLMQGLPAGGAMASLTADEARVAAAIEQVRDRVSIAAVNAPASVVISGAGDAVAEVCTRLAAEGVKSKPLTVSHAFHSPLMEPILDEFRRVAESVAMSAPRIPLVSNLSGEGFRPGAAPDAAYWVRHLREPVRFRSSLEWLRRKGFSAFLEVGPSPTLTGLGQQCLPEAGIVWSTCLRKGRDDWDSLLTALGALYVHGARVDWRAFDRDYVRRKVSLPTYPFERQRYWFQGAAAGAARALPAGAHPLLGRRLRSAVLEGDLFERELLAEDPSFLADHRVHALVVVPATAYVEMALAAAREAGAGEAVRLRDLTIHEALALEEGEARTVQVALAPERDGLRALRVFSSADGEEWRLHAAAAVSHGAPETAGSETLEEIRKRCSETLAPESLYERLEAIGLSLGPRFRGVRELRRSEGEGLARVEMPAGLASSGFVVHPVLLDACVQALAGAVLGDGAGGDAAFMPLAIEEVRLSTPLRGELWSHGRLRPGSREGETLTGDLTIFDASGRVVGTLSGIALKKADPAALRRLVEGRERALEDLLYEVEWRPKPLSARPAAESWPSPRQLVEDKERRLARLASEHGFAAYADLEPRLDAVVCAWVVEALGRLGLDWQPGARIAEADIAERLGVAERFRGALGRLLAMLEEQGLARRAAGALEVLSAPREPRPAEACAALAARHPAFAAEIRLVQSCAPRLDAVLRGQVDPLQLLFPEGSTAAAEDLYLRSAGALTYNALAREITAAAIAAVPAGPIRVLEIGGGTGGTTAALLPELPAERTEYLFTDVSPLFAARAAERFAAYPFLSTQALDVERDPDAQGLAGRRFDVVVAANVLHATRDLRRTFRHVRRLLAPGGLLLMLEVTRPQSWIDVTFGLTEGWWLFEDGDLRRGYPLLSRAAWQRFLAQEAGFAETAVVPAASEAGREPVQALVVARAPLAEPESTTADAAPADWLLLGDAGGLGPRLDALLRAGGAWTQRCPSATNADEIRRCLSEAATARNVVLLPAAAVAVPGDVASLASAAEGASRSVLALAQALAARKDPPRLWLVTRGAQAAGPSVPGLAQAPVLGLARSIVLEHPELRTTAIDLASSGQAGEASALAAELLGNDGEEQVALRPEGRLVARLVRSRVASPAAPAPWTLDITARGVLDNLVRRPTPRRTPGRGEVEIEVRAIGLNFRDVLNAMGLYPGAPPPFGSECVGRVSALGEGVRGLRVGEEVLAIAPGAFASHVVADAAFVVPKPSGLSSAEAATLAVAFVTASHCLEDVAGLREGESVLVHAAAGGVGLAAVQVAQRLGAEVFATAGSPEKREYLRAAGVGHVMDSRATGFGEAILAATGGRGVDVVLNSLSEFIDESLGATARGGRFVEIGKRGIRDERQVAAERPDLAYTVVDWGETARREPALIRGVLDRVMEGVRTGAFRPLPHRSFSEDDLVGAFRQMAQGRHLGKLVVGLPVADGAPIVREGGAYLVTGGLGGLGLRTAEWLVEKGARHVVLVGRHAPRAEAQEAIGRMEAAGATVRVHAADATDEQRMREVVGEIDAGGLPLRGVVHSAGVLDDGVLLQLDEARLGRVLAPKLRGALILHQLTQGRELDFFVLYSSVAALLGSPGQANHAAANAFLDALAAQRRSQGLPAVSLAWGAWEEIGAAARLGAGDRAAALGIRGFSPRIGLLALGRLLQPTAARVAVVDVDWPRLLERYPQGAVPAFFEALPRNAPSAPAAKARPAPPGLQALLAEAAPGSREHLLQGAVREQALKVLGLDPGYALDPKRPLQELGLDSLMAVELRNALGALVGRSLPATLLFDYPTLAALVAYMGAEVLGLATAAPAAEPKPAANVVASIEDLSDEEVERLLAAKRGAR